MLSGTPVEAAQHARALSQAYDSVADCLESGVPDDVPAEECQRLDVRIDEARRALEAALDRDDSRAAEDLRQRVDQLRSQRADCGEPHPDRPDRRACLELATQLEELEQRADQLREEGTLSASLEGELEAARQQLEACQEEPGEESRTGGTEARPSEGGTLNQTVPEVPERCQPFQQRLNVLQTAGDEQTLQPETADDLYGELWTCLEALFPGDPPEEYPAPCRDLLDATREAKTDAHPGGVSIGDVDTDRSNTLAKRCAQAAQAGNVQGENGMPGPGALLAVAVLGLCAYGRRRTAPRDGRDGDGETSQEGPR
jgi:hypothetical protein